MLAHTPVSRKVFLYFDCNDLAGVRLLRADYTINCDSFAYTTFMPLVLVVLFAFIVALPGFISFYLWTHRHNLYSTSVYQRIGWLYDPFVRGAEFWQVHDVLMKMILTGMLIYIPSTSRAGIGILVCVIAVANLNFFQPHKNKVLFWLTQLSFITTTTKYVVSLLLSLSDTADTDENFAMSIFLITLDIFFMASSVLAIFISICVLTSRVKQINRDEKAEQKALQLKATHIVPINHDEKDEKEEGDFNHAISKRHRRQRSVHSNETVALAHAIHDEFHESEIALRAEHKKHQQRQRRSTQLRVAARLKVRKTKVLSKIPIFASIPQYRMDKAVEAILAQTTYKKHAKGAIICEQGELADDFFIIVSGQCSVNVTNYNSQEGRAITRRVGALKDLDHFGESALLGGFEDLKRNATITVESDYVQLLVLSRLHYEELVEEGVITKDVTSTLEAVSMKRVKSNKIMSTSSFNSFALPTMAPPPPRSTPPEQQEVSGVAL
jgi:CRP-like cAMP-binding protein